MLSLSTAFACGLVVPSAPLWSHPIAERRSAAAVAIADPPSLAAPERFVATNRFGVRDAAKFERRWANRKSRLATLPGFRYFTLLRRVPPPDFFANMPPPTDAPDYVSLTVWETEADFDVWRSGDAFKEAHGGSGGIAAFASILKTALFITKGPPKPAFYEALQPVAVPAGSATAAPGGWRDLGDLDADGVDSLLPTEGFAVMNRWAVAEGKAGAFELAMDAGPSASQPAGLKFRSLLRRSKMKSEEGLTHTSLSVWDSEESFMGWRASEDRAASIKGMMDDGIISAPPSPLFFEGKLVIESAAGP